MKLNKILYKLDVIENKVNIVEEKMTSTYIDEECNIELPLLSTAQLALFEGQLEETVFKNHVVRYYISYLLRFL